MEVRVWDTAVLFLRAVKSEVSNHAFCHKLLLDVYKRQGTYRASFSSAAFWHTEDRSLESENAYWVAAVSYTHLIYAMLHNYKAMDMINFAKFQIASGGEFANDRMILSN